MSLRLPCVASREAPLRLRARRAGKPWLTKGALAKSALAKTALGCALALGLVGCSGASGRSEGAALAPGHPRIVSLNPCTDAVLAEVSVPGQLLAISSYSHDPASTSMGLAEASRYRGVSGSVEEIAALDPQVVVASSFLPPTTLHALEDLGIRVVREPIVTDVAGAKAQIRTLAALTGERAAGERLVARIDKALADSAPPPGWKPVPALVWQSAGLVAGNDALVMDLVRHAGFTNAAAARGLGQADYLPLEQVLADPPGVIFAAGNPLAEEDRVLRHPALAELDHTARFSLSRSLLWCAGPTVPRLLDRLAQARRSLAHGSTAKGAGE